MRYLYSLLTYLILPFIPFYLLKRSRKNKDYGLYWKERFAINLKNSSDKPIIWLHSVSVGETRAMAKLVELIKIDYPGYQILITFMTPTARATILNLYKNVMIHYVPYDVPHMVINFYKIFRPKIGLIMETEIWPNLVHYAYKFKIPLFLINARLSIKSFYGYNKVKFLVSPIINNFTSILCQDESTRDNFLKLGYDKHIYITGNTKFDLVYDKTKLDSLNFLKQNTNGKKLVVFFSTRDGEEKIIFDNLPTNIDYTIIVIPRHLERFEEVKKLLLKSNIKYQKRSQHQPIQDDTVVLIGDSIGEMMYYYNICDLAVVGGSFSNNGGQNLIEPLFMDIPVIFGQSMYNFETIAKNALEFNCALQVTDMTQAFKQIDIILKDDNKYRELVSNCQKFINEYTGASEKIIAIVSKFL